MVLLFVNLVSVDKLIFVCVKKKFRYSIKLIDSGCIWTHFCPVFNHRTCMGYPSWCYDSVCGRDHSGLGQTCFYSQVQWNTSWCEFYIVVRLWWINLIIFRRLLQYQIIIILIYMLVRYVNLVHVIVLAHTSPSIFIAFGVIWCLQI